MAPQLPSFSQLISSVESARPLLSLEQSPAWTPFQYTSKPGGLLNAVPRADAPERSARNDLAALSGPSYHSPPHVSSRPPPRSGPEDQSASAAMLSHESHLPRLEDRPLQPYQAVLIPYPSVQPQKGSRNDQDLTLAGKPRKRSAQACFRCREMKIKCRVQDDDCITCVRQGLRCTFAKPPSGLRRSRPRKIASAGSSDGRESKRRRTSLTVGQPSPSTSYDSLNSGSHTRQGSSIDPLRPASSDHVSSDMLPTPPLETASRGPAWSVLSHTNVPTFQTARLHSPVVSAEQPEAAQNSAGLPQINLSIAIDPVVIHPDPTSKYLDAFYAHLHTNPSLSPHLSILPARKSFFGEPRAPSSRTTNQKMLVYAIAAAGAHFSAKDNVDSEAQNGDQSEQHQRESLAAHAAAYRGAAEDALSSLAYLFEETAIHTQLVLKLMDDE